MKEYLAATVPGFRAVLDIVDDYMAELVLLGLLKKRGTQWSAVTPKGQAARAKWEQTKEFRKRYNALHEEVDAIKSASLRGGEIDFLSWAKRPAESYHNTPDGIAIRGGFLFDRLMNHLRSLRQMMNPYTYPTTDNLLGLLWKMNLLSAAESGMSVIRPGTRNVSSESKSPPRSGSSVRRLRLRLPPRNWRRTAVLNSGRRRHGTPRCRGQRY